MTSSRRPFRFQKTEFFCPELDHINKCAYSDYQREKVYVRTSPAIRKSLRRKPPRQEKTRRSTRTSSAARRSGARSAAANRSHMF